MTAQIVSGMELNKPTALWLLRQFITYLEGCEVVHLAWTDDVPRGINDPLDPAPAFVMDRGSGERRFEIAVRARKKV